VVAVLAAARVEAGSPGIQAGQPARITSVIRADSRTGKLVRSVVVTPKSAPKLTPRPVAAPVAPMPALGQTVERIAAEHALPPQLIHSVIRVESNYNPYAVSSKGALGLMQLIPATARRFGVSDVFDPVENIQGGARYLKYLLELYHNDYPLALAAYNAGEGAVSRFGGVPPYPETRRYIELVGKHIEAGSSPGPGIQPAPAPEPPPLDGPGVNHIREIVEPDGSVRYVSR
jgi:soluble lytic murein transglycosylase-like protein